MLRHSHEFTNLPSERGPHSNAAKLMLKLIDHAASLGSFSYYVPAERAKRAQRMVRDRAREGRPVETLDFDTRPGAFIERESEEVRLLLKELTSDDLNEILIDPNFVHDWEAPSKSEDYSRHTPDAAIYARMPRATR